MIIDALFGYLLALPNALLNSITSVGSIVIPNGAFEWWKNTIDMLTYIFPVYSLLPIMVISTGVKAFQIGYALVVRLIK